VSDQARIALVATGGTIDAVGADRLDLAHYTETRARLDDGQMLSSLPELEAVATIDEVPYRRVPSYALTTEDWLRLARTTQDLLDGDHDGVVITHGTNTLEESAFFLHLTVRSPKPVVLVGALRSASGLGSDGALNLLRAVQVAAAPQARGQGCLVVLNDTVHSARQVTKTSTFRVDAFRSPDTGPLGYADADGRVVIYHQPRPRDEDLHFPAAELTDLPRVDVVVSHVGADGVLIDAAVAAGARGLVSGGTGAGRPTGAEDEALDRSVAAGVAVCQATRVGSGRVARSPVMAQRGLIAADNLQVWKARVLLALGLTQTTDSEQLQYLFDRV
jgi:L-asparaginase